MSATTVTTASRREAGAALTPPRAALGDPGDPFGDLVEEFMLGLRAAGRSPATERAYRYALNDLVAYLGPDVQPETVSALDLSRWLLDRREQRSPANAAFLHRHSRPFYRFMQRIGVIEADPFARVVTPKVPTRVIETISDHDLRALLEACAGSDWRAQRDRALIRVLLDTGIRRGEAVSLRVEDVDLALGVIHVRVSKSGRARMVPIGLRSRRDLKAWLRSRGAYLARNGHTDSGALFTGREGAAFTPSGLFQTIEKRMQQAGVNAERACHVFRHTFATRALATGASDLDVMVIAGWTSPAMLRRYTASTESARAIAGHSAWGLGDRL